MLEPKFFNIANNNVIAVSNLAQDTIQYIYIKRLMRFWKWLVGIFTIVAIGYLLYNIIILKEYVTNQNIISVISTIIGLIAFFNSGKDQVQDDLNKITNTIEATSFITFRGEQLGFMGIRSILDCLVDDMSVMTLARVSLEDGLSHIYPNRDALTSILETIEDILKGSNAKKRLRSQIKNLRNGRLIELINKINGYATKKFEDYGDGDPYILVGEEEGDLLRLQGICRRLKTLLQV